MKTILFALAVTVATVSSASAQDIDAPRVDWKPIIVAAAGQLSDASVTWHQINAPALKCSEANPLLGSHPSAAKIFLPKLAAVGIASLVTVAASHAQNPAGRRVGKIVAYVVGVMGAGLAGNNLHTCGW